MINHPFLCEVGLHKAVNFGHKQLKFLYQIESEGGGGGGGGVAPLVFR